MNQLVRRSEALRHCAILDKSSYRILLVQAQAGQGKTVLVTQFEEASRVPFAWVTCNAGDTTPRILLERIVAATGAALDTFSVEFVNQAFQQQFSPGEFVGIATECVGAEFERGGRPLTVVLDDAHLLSDSPRNLSLLSELVRSVPSFIKFVIVSRYPLMVEGKPLFESKDVLEIDKSLLAFSREEISILYNEVLEASADTKKIDALLEATEGWVSGLKLLHSFGTVRPLSSLSAEGGTGAFFDELLLPLVTQEELREIALSSELDSLPEKMVRELFSTGTFSWLEDMIRKNCFARVNNEPSGRVFRLHHIFQEYLKTQARDLTSQEERAELLVAAGDWYLGNGKVKEGLRCYYRARHWERLSDSMQQHGFMLLAQNHQVFLMGLLFEVPETVRSEFPWLCYYYGAALFSLKPESHAIIIEESLILFREQGEKLGELLAICSLMDFQVLVSGEFSRKIDLVRRGEELFDELLDDLPVEMKASCAQSFALGKAYYESELQDALRYLSLGGDESFNPYTPIVNALVIGLIGDIETALDYLAPFFATANNSWASPTLRFSLWIIQLNYLQMIGDMVGYRAVREKLINEWKDYLDASFLGIFVIVWELDSLCWQGRFEEMIHLSRKCRKERGEMTPHMESQLHHYEMLAYAHLGRYDAMDRSMELALDLRTKSGGPYFIHLTQSLVAASLGIAGRLDVAEKAFEEVNNTLPRGHGLHHAALGFFYRAHVRLEHGQLEGAREDAKTALLRLKEFNNKHFFGWAPQVMEQVLCFAVREGIETEYAKNLARDQMEMDILDDGSVVPLLKIRTLGTVELSIGGVTMSGRAVSPMWQRVLVALATAPELSMEISKLQTALWPDQEPADTRSKFDTMLSRMRSKLGAAFGKKAVKRHLTLKAQRLQLNHCLVDYEKVVMFARQGVAFANDQKPWKAHNAFLSMAHWIGDSLDEIHGATRLPDRIIGVIVWAFTTWAAILETSHDSKQALIRVRQALHLDPLNDSLQRQQYDLLVALKRPREATQAIQKYRALLELHEFSEDEISQIIDNLLTGEKPPNWQ